RLSRGAPPAEEWDRAPDVAVRGRERAAPDAEVQETPARGLGRHLLPRPGPKQQLAHTRASSRSPSRGLAPPPPAPRAAHPWRDATGAPATAPRRTESTRDRSCNRPCPSAAANASPAP